MTPSRSPTAFATISHISKNEFCRNCWMGTSWSCLFLTRSLGANISPAQNRVLECVKRRHIWVERRYWRHGRRGKLVVATRPDASFLLGTTSTSLAVQPSGACFLQGIEIKSYHFQCPCRCPGAARVSRPDVLMHGDKCCQSVCWKQWKQFSDIFEILGIVDSSWWKC
jgi:hypothetical protein